MEKNQTLDLGDRYQFQPWYIKLWRRRWLLPVPFYALRVWWCNRKDTDFPLTFGQAVSIEIGMAHVKMKWYFTAEECGLGLGFGRNVDPDEILGDGDFDTYDDD
jgi:hypothetical protein